MNCRYDSLRTDMLDFVPDGVRRILDVGCATGAFSEALQELRPALETWGIESDPAATEMARSRMNSLIVGTYPEVKDQLPVGSFDCVVFNDVLEHMVDPGRALAATVPLLTSTGRIVASIPNVRHLTVLAQIAIRGDFEYTDTGLLDRTHLRFFTRRSILRLFADSGWHIEQIVGMNWHPWGRLPVSLQRGLCTLASGRLDEFFYLQYAVVARPARDTTANGFGQAADADGPRVDARVIDDGSTGEVK